MANNLPIRVLQATVSNDKGGLTGYICQNYRYINKEEVQFDFLTYEKKLDFQIEFENLGAKFFIMPKPSHFFSYYKSLKNLNEKNNYKLIHYNLSYANFVPIIAAKLAGFSRIIIHSHSTAIDDKRPFVRGIKKIIHWMGKKIIANVATDYLACSALAAEWMFTESIMKNKKYHVVKNAINLDLYKFNPGIREKIRSNLGIKEDTFCIGHIGRFSYSKNHIFLIDIFFQIHKKKPNSCLILIGGKMNGEKFFKEMMEKAEKLKISKYIKYLGVRNDVPDLLQAMDCLVLPSRFEGLGIVGIEAQSAGTPCIVSTKVPNELAVTNKIHFLSLKESSEIWADTILSVLAQEKSRTDQIELLHQNGYDILDSIKEIEALYIKS